MTAANPGVDFAAVIVGSVARNRSTDRSDIDVLFVSHQQLQRPRCPARVHAQLFRTDEFLQRLRARDDFASWCVRLGLPIADPGLWVTITAAPEASNWPDWKLKLAHAMRRLFLASHLLNAGDLTAASEEALYAATHTARALLLRSRVFPLSRPEVVEQLAAAGHRPLADSLRSLLAKEEDRRFLYRSLCYLKRLLISLDKASYAPGGDQIRARRCRAAGSSGRR